MSVVWLAEAGDEASLLVERIYGHDASLLSGPPPPAFEVKYVDVSPDVHLVREAPQPVQPAPSVANPTQQD